MLTVSVSVLGGALLIIQWVNNTYPAGLGEPLNIILSGDSDDDVLVQSADNGGFLNYMLYVYKDT